MIVARRAIRAPIESVFDWLADATNYPRALGIRHARLLAAGSHDRFGVRSRREVATLGGSFVEEIVEYRRPSRIRYTVLSSRPSLPHRGGTVVLAETAAGTEITWSIDLVFTTPLVGRLLTSVIAAAMGVGFRLILRAAERELTAVRTGPRHQR
ncbi:SRPBCC family protein [Nocardia coubleae]|uniref:SRPBCC family protein n=1 Tax=Nocardia coubleae TaxID=356147 RepID=A0A846W2I6_9NOCA|nr:SRPBCC family protein [Nocardia coubleae]NKX86838.1 hypothetical protein [Nocardia coubleae]